MNTVAHNIYIHVPFCASKCNYCAFFSHACANPDWEQYANEICSEINDWGQRLGRPDVPTVFFGGGTPSLMPVAIFERIINSIRHNFNILPGAEITLESNPGTLDDKKLNDFMSLGINRLSIGIQSIDDEKLAFLGRRHSVNDALKLIDTAHRLGLRTSGDFIYGLPGDTVKDVINTCKQINKIGLLHCSLYELTIEPDTPFGRMGLDMPSNDMMAQMYIAISDTLNIPRYEVSNYAIPGNECRHNQNVWDGDAYIGIGRGAAGRVFTNGVWYEQRGNAAQFDPIDNQTRAIEKVITGMRTLRGCRLTDDVKSVINMDWVNNNKEKVRIDDNRIMATARGLLILDDILINLVKEV